MEYAKYCNICGKKLHCKATDICPYDVNCVECKLSRHNTNLQVAAENCDCTDEKVSMYYRYSVLYAEYMDLQDKYRETQVELLQKQKELKLQQKKTKIIINESKNVQNKIYNRIFNYYK